MTNKNGQSDSRKTTFSACVKYADISFNKLNCGVEFNVGIVKRCEESLNKADNFMQLS